MGRPDVSEHWWAAIASRSLRGPGDLALAALDAVLVAAAFTTMLVLRYDLSVPSDAWATLPTFVLVAVAAQLVANRLTGVYGPVWQHASIVEAKRIVAAGDGRVRCSSVGSSSDRGWSRSAWSSPARSSRRRSSVRLRFQSRLFAFNRGLARARTRHGSSSSALGTQRVPCCERSSARLTVTSSRSRWSTTTRGRSAGRSGRSRSPAPSTTSSRSAPTTARTSCCSPSRRRVTARASRSRRRRRAAAAAQGAPERRRADARRASAARRPRPVHRRPARAPADRDRPRIGGRDDRRPTGAGDRRRRVDRVRDRPAGRRLLAREAAGARPRRDQPLRRHGHDRRPGDARPARHPRW
jgi:hypothetical protein